MRFGRPSRDGGTGDKPETFELLVICFLREAPEIAIGSDRRAGKWGLIDFPPTILKLAGAQIPADLTGLDLLDRKAMTARKSVFVEAYTHNIADLDKPAESLIARVVIDGWSKLIIPGPNKPDRPFSTVPEGVALYDLMTDPLEKTNIAAKRPDEVKRLTALQNAHWLVE